MNRYDLQQLATTRLDEAQTLLEAGRFSGAYYLAGYAVECALKAVIARETRQYDFPDRQRATRAHTHNLADLLTLAGLQDELGSLPDRSRGNWNIVRVWSEVSRYQVWQDAQARQLLQAVSKPEDGVFPWVSRHW